MACRTAACLLLLSCAGACSKQSRPWVHRFEVDALEGGEVASVSKEQVEQLLLEKLIAAKFVIPAPTQKVPSEVNAWGMKLAVALGEPDIERHTLSITIVLEARPYRQSEVTEPFTVDSKIEVRALEGQGVEATQGLIRQALGEAVGRAVRESAALISLEGAADPSLVAKLHDADPAVSDAAVRLLIRRRNRAALPVLLQRLKAEDINTLRPVIGLLVELKAQEAVNPLIEAASRRGPVLEREVVFAVGAIGGSDAEAYLDLVATGHDDPLLRASAEQALMELRQEKPTPSSGEPP